MKIELNYGKNVLALPQDPLQEKLADADALDLRLLVCLASDADLRENFNARADELTSRFRCTRRELNASLEFWRSSGAVKTVYERSEKGARPADVPQKRKAADFPHYTGKEAEAIINEGGLASVVDECGRILRRTFNPTDVNTIIAMYQQLGVDSSYIIMLCDYCARIEKRSLAYIRKMAYDLYDEGVDSTEKLEAYIHKRDAMYEFETKLRSAFGIEGRALTVKEKNCFEKWNGWGMSPEMAVHAYGITVEKTGKYTVTYLDRVLTNWHDAGYSSLADVEEAEKRYSEAKAGQQSDSEGSFRTDDFFDAALKRTRDSAIRLLDEKEKKAHAKGGNSNGIQQ